MTHELLDEEFIRTLPASNPTPRTFDIELELGVADHVDARIDLYSDRVWCEHPDVDNGEELGALLKDTADEHDRGRIVVMTDLEIADGLERAGFRVEAVIPTFYEGAQDCAVMSFALDKERDQLADPEDVARVEAIIDERGPSAFKPNTVSTEIAKLSDAANIATLIDDTFEQYPTPSGVASYVAKAIRAGTPFRMVKENGVLVACASADLTRSAMAAELTDCATLPTHRGKGFMKAILSDLMGDLRKMGYDTAFTLARARIAGVNIAFESLGFDLHGTMRSSCRIGQGIEDMNVWSRSLSTN